jgi:hypothetical protein
MNPVEEHHSTYLKYLLNDLLKEDIFKYLQ